ncbi:MAG: quinolinate synthase NadA [Lachnospiraceae bacterium]|nr:quinolinate synthase NadA [Lachnospiraceae bacterium]
MEKTVEEIKKLAKEKDAVILAHYYVDGAIQEIADYVGDSFFLAKKAKEVENKTIVFCGVTFMGESAAILNPDKTILLPNITSRCPMAEMVDEEEIEKMREQYDDLAVVCYINSNASTKELVDVCVTSSNALKILKNLPQKNIYFIPDQNLGSWLAKQVPEKNFIMGSGFCHVHHSIEADYVKELKEKYKGVKLLAHPECKLEVCELADYVGSTSGIIDFATSCEDKEFLIATEAGVLHELQKRNPDKVFHFVPKRSCMNMHKITLDQVLECLQANAPQAVVSEKVRVKAEKALDNMLKYASL